MKLNIILAFTLATLVSCTACNKKDKTTTPNNNNTNTNSGNVTFQVNNQGKDTLNFTGTVVQPSGTTYSVAIQQNYFTTATTAPDGVLTLLTNVAALPTQTTTYTLVDFDDYFDDHDPSHVTITLDYSLGNADQKSWYSATKLQGTITLQVTGNKITADLSNIELSYNDAINPANYKYNGKLGGTLTIYK